MCSVKDNDSLTNTLAYCLSQQIGEYELLKSMYPGNNELVLSDPKIIPEIELCLQSASDYTPSHLDFVLNLSINDMKIELCINLPSFYPNEEPDIYVRCNQLNRQQETSLNNGMSAFIRDTFEKEVFLFTIITWLHDHIDEFIEKPLTNTELKKEEEPACGDKFSRLWIYSHHIYNKKKRDLILTKAKEFSLTGFCMPGKPGIICIEGIDANCKEWWRFIKSLTWQRIIVRQTETYDIQDQHLHQKFKIFQELYFPNSSNKNRHADMSGFSKFMEEHALTEIFNDFFGLHNDSSS